uniref:CX domain-containing protein n=1 Tax=Haemonchus contortus TaxID=6289 RepID=A0A7I5E9R7_HAECO
MEKLKLSLVLFVLVVVSAAITILGIYGIIQASTESKKDAVESTTPSHVGKVSQSKSSNGQLQKPYYVRKSMSSLPTMFTPKSDGRGFDDPKIDKAEVRSKRESFVFGWNSIVTDRGERIQCSTTIEKRYGTVKVITWTCDVEQKCCGLEGCCRLMDPEKNIFLFVNVMLGLTSIALLACCLGCCLCTSPREGESFE